MKVGFAWASLGAVGVLAGALGLAFLAAGGSTALLSTSRPVDRAQFEGILSTPVSCNACQALDTLTKRFARSDDALSLGFARRLAAWRVACTKEQLCRVPQMAEVSSGTLGECSDTEAEVDHLSVYGEIRGLARVVLARSQECEGMSCPLMRCDDKAPLYNELEQLASMLDQRGQLAAASDQVDDDEHAAMARMMRAFRRSARDQTFTIAAEFQKLASLIHEPPGQTRGLADLEEWLKWRQRHIHRLADDIDYAAAETALPYDGLSEGLWRIRTLAIVLGNVTDALGTLRETQREHVGLIEFSANLSREGQIDIYRAWQGLGDAIGETMLYMARITAVLNRLEEKPDWQTSLTAPGPISACTRLDSRQAQDAATKIRHALARFDFCGMRGGCTVGEQPQTRVSPADKNPYDGATDHELRDKVVKLRDRLVALSLEDSPPVRLTGEYDVYRPGEAMSVRARGGNNMCYAAGGSWIGIYRDNSLQLTVRQDRNGPLRRRDLEAIVEHETEAPRETEVMLEVPTVPGQYRVRIFAGPVLGGTQIGEMPLRVESAEHLGCDGFSGHWQSKKSGDIWLSVRGNKVTGTYRRSRGAKPGIIVGRIRQDQLRGHWSTEFGSGGLALKLSENGTHFTGTAGWSRDQTTGAGDWEGFCVVSDSPS